MPRPLTRAQTLENAAFLKALRLTGNAREAARLIGEHRAKFTKRRAAHPAFAAEWDAALAVAHASLATVENPASTASEPRIIRIRTGKLQLRRIPAGRLTREAEQAFLAALSATANVRLAAQAAGFSHAAFYARRRQSEAFAREMRLALQTGYDRLELALCESSAPGGHTDDGWRHNELPPIPRLSAAQALQALYLHQKEARLQGEPAHIKRRRGETTAAHAFRLAAMYEAGQERDREASRIAEAARHQSESATRSRHDPAPPILPALDQVTGWSKARPDAEAQKGDAALFGGWRLANRKGKRD